jgi:hypothetical protein
LSWNRCASKKVFLSTYKWMKILDADEVLIPSMLVQPYVENALWHGLMHKDGERQLL